MDVRAAHHRKKVETGGSHTFQCEIERVVGVNMGKIPGVHDLSETFFSIYLGDFLELRQGNNSPDSFLVEQWPCSQAAPTRPLDRFTNRRVRLKGLSRRMHGETNLEMSLRRFRRGKVDTFLT
jgi:hypothetical protein